MFNLLICLAIATPFIGGLLINAFRKADNLKIMHWFTEIVVIITSILVFVVLFNRPADSVELIKFTDKLSICFKVDGLGTVFAAMIAFLWPFATLYSFEYMKHEGKEYTFFTFYTMTYGVTLGISLAGNLLTMYCFYEMLTLVTIPLVVHTGTREAIRATRKYIYYSLGGAAFAFIGLIFLTYYGTTNAFTYGGILDLNAIGDNANILRLIFVFAFMGFSVKAAMFPFHGWLPDAGVAPTPVTALLHAVAVVKSGAFATMRLTYYCFGPDFLRGTWAQYVIMVCIIFTIVFGCSMAVKETHLKRRLAFSTVSNLSYILFGVSIMTPLGLVGALSHMVFHAFMKILSFLCAGAVIVCSGKKYVNELDGLGRRMPHIFTLFTISSLALMGVPGLCGFVSKWNLATAAFDSGNVMAYVGVVALLISALLTGIYMMTIVFRAWVPGKDFDTTKDADVKDPTWRMLIPLYTFALGCVIFGLFSPRIVDFFTMIANGLL